MDNALFSSLIKNLLHTDVTIASEDSLKQFEDKYCYNASLQPFYLQENLINTADNCRQNTVYEYRDILGTCVLLTVSDGTAFVIGPFMRRDFSEKHLQELLMEYAIPASFIGSLKQYLSAFPIIAMTQALNTVFACLQSLSDVHKEISTIRIGSYDDVIKKTDLTYQDSLDYTSIYRRYEAENQFLRCIESGDTDNVMIAYQNMNLSGLSNNRYINAVYQEPAVGMGMLRALCRKAAENGGAPLVEINEITQRSVQRMVAHPDLSDMMGIMNDTIMELTAAVRDSKQQYRNYSPSIRKAAEYLRRNYSQKISLDDLAGHVGMSSAHLSRLFKKESGMTVTDYLSNLRCIEASRLLRESQHSIQDIAAYVGYLDNNYFVKVFKKQFGMTPSEYRNQSL